MRRETPGRIGEDCARGATLPRRLDWRHLFQTGARAAQRKTVADPAELVLFRPPEQRTFCQELILKLMLTKV
jgi:hypothetical protein